MYAIATFLVVAAITLVFTKLATGALIATGMPPGIAAFQARSAFSGAGFTTTEAENVVNHPVRRRIIATTMFVGALGTPTLVVTVLVGLIAPGPGSTTERSLVATSGAMLLILLILNRPVTRLLERIGRHYARERLIPVLRGAGHELLVVADDFVVAAREVGEDPVNSPRSIRGLDHAFPGVTVLGVQRGMQLIGEPPTDISLHSGDALIVFGRRDKLTEMGLLPGSAPLPADPAAEHHRGDDNTGEH